MDTLETILVKGADGGPLRINASDFKVGEHELYEAPAGEPVKNEAPAAQPVGQPIPGAPVGAPAPAKPK